ERACIPARTLRNPRAVAPTRFPLPRVRRRLRPAAAGSLEDRVRAAGGRPGPRVSRNRYTVVRRGRARAGGEGRARHPTPGGSPPHLLRAGGGDGAHRDRPDPVPT